MTQAELQIAIDQIKNETGIGANTKARIANVLESVKDKVRPYKVYTALLSQFGANPPTAEILENTLGFTPVWTRFNAGNYGMQGDSSIASKQFICCQPAQGTVTVNRFGTGGINIATKKYLETNSPNEDGINGNELLSRSSFEVRIYE